MARRGVALLPALLPALLAVASQQQSSVLRRWEWGFGGAGVGPWDRRLSELGVSQQVMFYKAFCVYGENTAWLIWCLRKGCRRAHVIKMTEKVAECFFMFAFKCMKFMFN